MLAETDTQPAREMPKAEVQNHLLKEKVLKVNQNQSWTRGRRDDALSGFLEGCHTSDLTNCLSVPFHRCYFSALGNKEVFFSPLEWHKNKPVNSCSMHTYRLHFFSVGKYHHTICKIKNHYTILFILLKTFLFFLYTKSEMSLGD